MEGVCLVAGWGHCEFGQLEELNRRLEQALNVDADVFFRTAAKDLAARLHNKVVKRTPVVYGTMRNAWAIMLVGQRGEHYTIALINNLVYASYVEYGHWQTPGRFIPGYWQAERFVYDPNAQGGMVLKKHWVKGRFMLTISSQELEQQMPAILEAKLYDFIKRCFDAE